MTLSFTKFRQPERFYLLIIALVAFLVMSPVLFGGLPKGYDLPHHYQCAMSYYEGIIAGDFYPSWSATRNFGYGGMELRLYPPISHYSLAVFYLIFGDWHIATWFTLTFFTFIGSLGVYLWAREFMNAPQAAFAGVMYALLPYHLNQIYNTFFYAEFVGSALLPFVFVYLVKVCKRGNLSDVIGLGISYSILLLTHLPLTVIGSLCLGIYGISLLRKEKIVSQITKLAIGVFLGLTSSSFFWIKVVQERDLLAKTLNYADPWLDYRLHFLLSPLQTYTGIGVQVYENSIMYYDLMLLSIVVAGLAATLPFLIFSRKNWKPELKGIWWLFAVTLFLVTPFSRFVWDLLSFLQEVQFSWRWLAILSIVGSILSASQLDNLILWFQDKRRPFALIICGCLLASITFTISQIIRPAQLISRAEVPALMQKIETDEGFTFWWTIWTKKEVFDVREKVVIPDRNIQIQKWTATEREFQISEGRATEAHISTLYHPNWKVTVNGKDDEAASSETGSVIIKVPSQSVNVKLYFEETFSTGLCRKLSGGAWLIVIFALCILKFRKTPRMLS